MAESGESGTRAGHTERGDARRPRVVVVGSANMDLVATTPTLPRPRETVLGNDFTMVPGGKGANQAIAAARAGADCAFLGAIGSDAFGVTLKARLTASEVDTTYLRVVYGTSGVAVIMVDAGGENAIVVSPGANGALTPPGPQEIAVIEAADVLVCQLEIPLPVVIEAARAAHAAGTRVVLNAAPARALPDELLASVDLLVVNEVEAQEITGRGRGEPAALLDVAARAVLTLGDEGAWYVDRDGTVEHVAAPVVETVDSTGAGDAFTGALAVAWGENRPLLDAVRWASAAGGACARRLGASNSLPHRSDIDQLYRTTYLT